MIVSRSPVTGEVLGQLKRHDDEDVHAALQRARYAQRGWGERAPRERVACLEGVLQGLIANRELLSTQLIAETGKVKGDALQELLMLFETFRYYLREAPGLLRHENIATGVMAHKRARAVRRPLGVVGVIAPWNFPLDLGLGEAIPALLAGNAVLLKPSPYASLINIMVAEQCEQRGLPSGLLQVLVGGAETGQAICERVDHITFTGSTRTGRLIAQVAARRLIPCTLELGGKDAMLVLSDASLDRAAAAAVWGGFFNSGQMCMSVERVYVDRSVVKTFLAKVVERTRALKQGADTDYAMDVGSMTHTGQVEVVHRHVTEAVEQGAIIEIGGRLAGHIGPCFYEPTILSGVDHTMRIMTEETFGPVIAVMTVEDHEEAIALANDSEYGLNASVWSQDMTLARRIAERLETGSVCINDVVVNYGLVDAPFSGVKASGLGQRHGKAGLLKYTQVQVITEDKLGLKDEPNWYPYSNGRLRRLGSVIDVLGGLWGRLKPGRKP